MRDTRYHPVRCVSWGETAPDRKVIIDQKGTVTLCHNRQCFIWWTQCIVGKSSFRVSGPETISDVIRCIKFQDCSELSTVERYSKDVCRLKTSLNSSDEASLNSEEEGENAINSIAKYYEDEPRSDEKFHGMPVAHHGKTPVADQSDFSKILSIFLLICDYFDQRNRFMLHCVMLLVFFKHKCKHKHKKILVCTEVK